MDILSIQMGWIVGVAYGVPVPAFQGALTSGSDWPSTEHLMASFIERDDRDILELVQFFMRVKQ